MDGKQNHSEKDANKQKKVVIFLVIVVNALLIFGFAAYKLIGIYSGYRESEQEYDNVAEGSTEIQTPEEEEESFDQDGHVPLLVDFDKLKKTNRDVVGWIRFDEPEQIDYPIVKGEDNEKYLTTTFTGKKNSAGAIFMDALNNSEFADRNTYIYGHNMNNGEMFAKLHDYSKKEYYEQNPYFYIYTPDGKESKYQIFAVCMIEGSSRSYTRFFNNDEDYLDYLNYEKSIAFYDTGVEVDAESKIVTLSTCTKVSKSKRLFVHGVKVAEMVIGESK